MLLRSISKHVTDQNWFAVFLDFIIVVVGVFIGIQVANWNAERLTKHEASMARTNLVADLQNDRDVYLVRKKYYSEVKQAAIRVNNTLNSDLPKSLTDQWDFVYDAINAGSMWPFKPSGQIYNQLLNSGKLELVGNVTVQRQMRDYYQDAALESGLTFKFDSSYRDSSRSLIHWKLIEYRRKYCNQLSTADPSNVIDNNNTYLYHCPIPSKDEETVLDTEIVNSTKALLSAVHLKQDANLALIQVLVVLDFLNYLDGEASTLISILKEQ